MTPAADSPAPNPALAAALAALDEPARASFRAGLLSGLLAALDALGARGHDHQSYVRTYTDVPESDEPRAGRVAGEGAADPPLPLGDVPAATDAAGGANAA